MLGKITVRKFITIGLSFYLGASLSAWSDAPCHPECRWLCDNPVCPAICTTTCGETICQDATCEKDDCECPSFGDLQTFSCMPLENDCPFCKVGRPGIDCQDGNGQQCMCTARCETKDCTVECEKPACPTPKCELVCQDPLCPLE